MELRYQWLGRQMTIGSAFGYSRAGHALGYALQQAGGIEDESADLAVTFTSPNVFRPTPGKFNVLITMNESDWMVPWALPGLQAADAIVVPCEWNKKNFARFTKAPIYVCPLGVFEIYQGVDREKPSPKERPFRFFWVGAHNQRKGWPQLYEAWQKAFVKRDDVELYMKSTRNPGTDDHVPIGVQRQGNIFVDSRVVSETDMYGLYVKADAFVFPSWGEGWGLPLAEAMATALPCAATLVGGVLEYADDTVCRGIRWERTIAQVHSPQGFLHFEPMAAPRIESIVENMEWILTHHKHARKMAHRAWERMQKFTWAAAGQKLLDILTTIERGRGDRGADRRFASTEGVLTD